MAQSKPKKSTRSTKATRVSAKKTSQQKKQTVKITTSSADTSPYVVNLKNPQSAEVDLVVSRSSLPPKKAKIPTPPKKVKGTNKNDVRINLIPRESAWSRLVSKKYQDTHAQDYALLDDEVDEASEQEVENEPIVTNEPEQLTEVISSAINSIQLDDIPTEVDDVFATPQKKTSVPKIQVPKVRMRVVYRSIAVFLLVCVVLVLPLQAFTYYQKLQGTKSRLLGAAGDAISELLAGREAVAALDLDGATANFGEAKEKFSIAQQEVSSIDGTLRQLIDLLPGYGDSVKAGEQLLKSGEQVSELGQLLSQSAERLFHGGDLTSYYATFIELEQSLSTAMGIFNQVSTDLQSIDSSLIPDSHRKLFVDTVASLPMVRQGIVELHDVSNALLRVLGHEQWQRYLLVFVNNNELRGGGGFMGTFGILDIDRGQIKQLFIPAGGTYDVQGQLKPKVISPEPLHLINSRWEFQDANWWPDFPTAAQKMEWFYENSWAQSVDGVIVLDSTLVQRIIGVLGSIEIPEFGITVTGDNFVNLTQEVISEEKQKEENRPKQILSDLAPKLMDAIFGISAEQMPDMLSTLQTGFNERHLLMYFNNERVQEVVDRFGWSGRVKDAEHDYLMVVHTNIAGGKSDGVVDDVIDHQVELMPDGTLEAAVTLTRNHKGVRGENEFTGVQNNSYVRFYVPEGSTLISATGFERPPADLFEEPADDFEIDQDLQQIEQNHRKDDASGTDIWEESNKTVFGNWLLLPAGESRSVTLRYTLPFGLQQVDDGMQYYSFLAQKQHGSINSVLTSTFVSNPGAAPIKAFPEQASLRNNQSTYSAPLTTDQFYAVVLN